MLLAVFIAAGAKAEKNDKSYLETLGYVSGYEVFVRSEPDTKSKVLSRLKRGAKLEILAKQGDWFKVKFSRTMEGYVHSEFVTFKLGNIKASIDQENVEKRFKVEVNNLVDTFNDKVLKSKIIESYKVTPSIAVTNVKNSDDIMSVSLVYSGKDGDSKIVSSSRDNPLSKNMKDLMEIIFLKMMLTKADKYSIEIKMPDFADGKHSGVYKIYTVLELEASKMDIESIKNIDGKIWDYVKTAVPHQILFAEYPR